MDERSAQVRMMDFVFSSAERVVVYLGEETEGTRLLFEELEEADRTFESSGKWDRRKLPASIIQELDILLARPYFSRIWVIQEVFMARSTLVMCGSCSVPLRALMDCIYGYLETRVTAQRIPAVLSGLLQDCDYTTNPRGTLWYLLARTRNCISTDPRDGIFALKGLMLSGAHELDSFVDYDHSVELVFTNVTEYLLPCVQLWFLLAIRHPHPIRENFPSWVPDWSSNSLPRIPWFIGDPPELSEFEPAPEDHDMDDENGSFEFEFEDTDQSKLGEEDHDYGSSEL